MNRKQRRIAASKGRKSMSKKNKKNGKVTMDPATADTRLQGMFAGNVEPPTELVAYFISKAKEIAQQGEQVQRQLTQARQAVIQLEARGRELAGAHAKYIEDIRHWDQAPDVPDVPDVPEDTVEEQPQPEA